MENDEYLIDDFQATLALGNSSGFIDTYRFREPSPETQTRAYGGCTESKSFTDRNQPYIQYTLKQNIGLVKFLVIDHTPRKMSLIYAKVGDVETGEKLADRPESP